MKVKNTNELWLLNKTSLDVHLSDLGVKILAGKTVNVYKFNPHLTKKQVTESRKTGSLHKRLTTKTLVIVKKDPKGQQAIENLKASEESNIKAIKTKSSVVLGPESNIDEPDGDFTFADYGINMSDTSSAARTKQDDGSIVVTPTQDEVEEQDPGIKLEPVIESGVSKQSQIVMKTAQEAMTDPSGPHAKSSVPTQSQPFVVTKPPEPEEPETEVKTPTGLIVSKNEANMVIVGDDKKPRSIQKIKRAKENLADDDEMSADEVIEFEKTEFDSKEPVKTNDGSIIMKLKNEEPVSKVKKAVVKKKRKTSKKKKKKTKISKKKAKVSKKKDVK